MRKYTVKILRDRTVIVPSPCRLANEIQNKKIHGTITQRAREPVPFSKSHFIGENH